MTFDEALKHCRSGIGVRYADWGRRWLISYHPKRRRFYVGDKGWESARSFSDTDDGMYWFRIHYTEEYFGNQWEVNNDTL